MVDVCRKIAGQSRYKLVDLAKHTSLGRAEGGVIASIMDYFETLEDPRIELDIIVEGHSSGGRMPQDRHQRANFLQDL